MCFHAFLNSKKFQGIPIDQRKMKRSKMPRFWTNFMS